MWLQISMERNKVQATYEFNLMATSLAKVLTFTKLRSSSPPTVCKYQAGAEQESPGLWVALGNSWSKKHGSTTVRGGGGLFSTWRDSVVLELGQFCSDSFCGGFTFGCRTAAHHNTMPLYFRGLEKREKKDSKYLTNLTNLPHKFFCH